MDRNIIMEYARRGCGALLFGMLHAAAATAAEAGGDASGSCVLLYVGGAVVVLVVAATVGWRLASGRRHLPCPVWLGTLVEMDNPFTRTNRAAVVIERLDVRPGMTAADIGCGPGRVTVPLAEAVGPDGFVVALDMQSGMLDRARKKAEDAGVKNIRFVNAGVGDGALEKDGLDRAVLVTVLGEIPDRRAAMGEIVGALKPGGVLSVTEVVFDPHFQRRSTVRAVAGEAGLREKALFGHCLAYTLLFEKPAD